MLVDFWAPWCAPCRMVAPSLEAIAKARAGQVKIAKVNVDENQALAARFGIRSIPTLAVFQGGRAVDQLVGALPWGQIRGAPRPAGLGAQCATRSQRQGLR